MVPEGSQIPHEGLDLGGRGEVSAEEDQARGRRLPDEVQKLAGGLLSLESDHHHGASEELRAVAFLAQGAPPSRTIVLRMTSASEAPGLRFRYFL